MKVKIPREQNHREHVIKTVSKIIHRLSIYYWFSCRYIIVIPKRNCFSCNITLVISFLSEKKNTQIKWSSWLLRLPTECFIVIVSAMFGAIFNLVSRVGPPQFLEHRNMVDWKLIVYYQTIVRAADRSSKMASTLCQKWF